LGDLRWKNELKVDPSMMLDHRSIASVPCH